MTNIVNDAVSVSLPKALLLRIQAKSEMPAIEGLEGILTRVLNEHDTAYPNQPKHVVLAMPVQQEQKSFKTQRGFELPIGLELFANYDGKHLTAKVTKSGIEYKGKTYEVSPSAFAAKKDCGATDTAASTNGWKFWMFKKDGRAQFIDALRPPVGQK
ncbi:DUF2924 domain-containing protein (plasmid) [Cupriavidus sp. P-10]|uniref:DUF2924 domain-containing protein n=1 Tax=Cupriavidus sp. P-10 TaxID=2027911 RepID=UPI000EC727E2|nr:DUF2924 domain-containing protein [Cupriavidus sp. P-10]BDB29040.1 DUF2924 domain-containing protein [Cupriavidus sp. P-10]